MNVRQTPVAPIANYTARTIGAEWHERTAQADRAHRYETAVSDRALCVASYEETKDKLATAERNESQWRSERVSLSNRLAEIAAGISAADASIRANLPAPGAPVAPRDLSPLPIGPKFSEAMSMRSSADAVAMANGYPDARAHARARLLASVDALARAAIEADVAAMDRALDLAVAGKEVEALALANALVTSKGKAK